MAAVSRLGLYGGPRAPYVVGGDVTAPTLTSPASASTGATTGSGTVSTDENNGTLFWIVDQSATPPSVAQIQAGLDNGGAAADDSGNQSVIATGTQNISSTGLTESVVYYIHFQHQDAATNDSTVVTSAAFTPTSSVAENIVFSLVRTVRTKIATNPTEIGKNHT